MMCLFKRGITRTLRSDDGDGNENVKEATDLSKTTTLHVHKCFLYISLPSLHDYDGENAYFRVLWRTYTRDGKILFLNLDMVLKNSTPGRFVYIW